jgi:hypothetical protein
MRFSNRRFEWPRERERERERAVGGVWLYIELSQGDSHWVQIRILDNVQWEGTMST